MQVVYQNLFPFRENRAMFAAHMDPSTFHTGVSPSLFFKGRSGDPRLGEWVRSTSLIPASLPGRHKRRLESLVIWGCPDDAGVLRNRGRAGAKDGPDSIRKHLYKMTPPMSSRWEDRIQLWDYGNLVPGQRIDETQARCREIAASIASTDATLIALGGGHDFAAPNFLGFMEGNPLRGPRATRRFGLINVDPHLDVRELEEDLPHSGTPFRQILESKQLSGKLFVEFGARINRNARAHYDYCRAQGVTIQTLEAIRSRKIPAERQFRLALTKLSQKAIAVGVTFDMDACAEAEGVSAPPVIGFSAAEMIGMAQAAGEMRKVRYFEIAEVAPTLDPTERSSRIAAEMIYAFLSGRARGQS